MPRAETNDTTGAPGDLRRPRPDFSKLRVREALALYGAYRTLADVAGRFSQGSQFQGQTFLNSAGEILEDLQDELNAASDTLITLLKAMKPPAGVHERRWWAETLLQDEMHCGRDFEDIVDLARSLSVHAQC